MKERLTETFLFRDNNIAKKKVGNYLSSESYDKNDIIGAVEKAIIDKKLKKAVKIDNPKRYNNHIYYVFKIAEEESKTAFRVGVPRKSYDENDPYIRSLNALKESGVNIKIANRTKLVAKAGALIIAGTLIAGAMLYGCENQAKSYDIKMEKYFEDINRGRAENGLPPMDLVDENGNSYDSWEQYRQDQKKLYEEENQEVYPEEEFQKGR